MTYATCFVVAAVIGSVTGAAEAGVIGDIAAHRAGRADAGIDPVLGTGSSVSNDSLGNWNTGVFWSPEFGEPQGQTSYIGGAGLGQQNTTIGFDGLFGTLESIAWDGNQGYGGVAEATLSAVITVDEATPFELSGSWHADSRFSVPSGREVAYTRLTFSGPGIAAVQAGTFGDTPVYSGNYDFSGLLSPGQYTLTITTWAYVVETGLNVNSRSGSMEFSLSLPAPGAAALLGVGGLFAARRHRS